MPNIRPISDLRNYNEVLNDVAENHPVYLTKNGRGCYAIIDLNEYERKCAELELLGELTKGKISGDEMGWRSSAEVEEYFRNKLYE